MSDTPTQVSVWKAQVVAGGAAVLSCMVVAAFVVSGHPFVAVVFVPAVLVSVLLLLVYGPIQADGEGLWMDGSLEAVGMKWAEMKKIRFGRFQLVIEGEGKRLVLPKPAFWTGAGRAQVLDYLQLLARDYCTPPPPSRTADLVMSRNATRIAPPTLK